MLPSRTTAEEVETIVQYLKTKATGVTITEAKATIEQALLDYRKISAYEMWGFIEKDGERIKLSKFGRDYSRAAIESKKSMYCEVIRRVYPYRLAAEWMFHQGFEHVTSEDLAAHWLLHRKTEVSSTEKTIREQVASFFSVAEAADLGKRIVGRKGQSTRLIISKDALGQFIGETSLEPKVSTVEIDVEVVEQQSGHGDSDIQESKIDIKPQAQAISSSTQSKVFISHSRNKDIVEQIKTMLDLASIEYEVAIEEETTAIPVPEKVLSAMHRCNAAIICVTADETLKKEDGTHFINENVLIEIGAAFVLYEKKVVLVWDRRVPVPSNIQGLYRCEFEGEELTWSAGMKLMKAISNFKK